MLTRDHGGVTPALRDQADRILFERIRVAAWLVLAALPFYVVADYYMLPPTFRLLQIEKAILAVVCLLAWWVTLHDELRRYARLTGLTLFAVISATSAVSSNLTGQYTTHAFLSVMMTLFAATLAPWGAATQLLAVLVVAASVLWNTYVVTGSFAALLGYPAVTVGVTWAVSVYVAWLLEESRRALAREALETARLVEELNRSDRFKSDFVANMSHELRTPLNVIIGYHGLLLDGTFGPLTAPQRDTVQRTDQHARELLDLINATLDLSRTEATPARIETRPVDVAEIFDELAREIGDLPGAPQLQWAWRVAPGLPAIRTDAVKLRMVLKNLIDNARKFTPQGTISVEAQPNGSGVEFRVADTGMGIAPGVQAHIFEPFFQADMAGRRPPGGGAGLGLYIVRRLVDRLGGRISVESEVGRGSLFRVWLPYDGSAGDPGGGGPDDTAPSVTGQL